MQDTWEAEWECRLSVRSGRSLKCNKEKHKKTINIKGKYNLLNKSQFSQLFKIYQ